MNESSETRVDLTDDALSDVTGGITADEIIQKIKDYYAWVPKEILDKITTSISTQGFKAARTLVERLAKNIPTIKGIADLIPRE